MNVNAIASITVVKPIAANFPGVMIAVRSLKP